MRIVGIPTPRKRRLTPTPKAPPPPLEPTVVVQSTPEVEHTWKVTHSASLEYVGSNLNNKNGLSQKFYIIAIAESPGQQPRLYRRWGRIGTTGQLRIETMPSLQEAVSKSNQLYNNKIREGYDSKLLTEFERNKIINTLETG